MDARARRNEQHIHALVQDQMRPFPTSSTIPPPRPVTLTDRDMDHSTETKTRTDTETETEPENRRARTQFYLPSPATNTDVPLSRTASRPDPGHPGHSRRQSAYSSSLSMPGSPSHPSNSSSKSHLTRRSRTSLAGLRNALHTYRVPSEGEYDPETPPASAFARLGEQGSELSFGPAYSRGGRLLDYGGDDDISSEGFAARLRQGGASRDVLRSPLRIGQEMMDALVEIHRVLYRGREDMQLSDGQLRWDEQGQEVRRVVERWFEGDCIYDHPLAKVTSRESLWTHFVLLHLLSTGYLPSISLSALIQHARSITSALRSRLLGGDNDTDIERSAPPTNSYKGKKKAQEVEEIVWFGMDTPVEERRDDKGWWKAWDVSADCREIGGMECYDGYHLALIEQTITLTIFPSLSSRRASSIPSTPMTSASYDLPTAGIPPPSFLRRLAQGLAEEFDYLLHWDLPISTMVEFNEVGKATRVRDIIDVGDAIETFIPFAKRLGWITRRLTGFITSTMGSLALSVIATPQQSSQTRGEGAVAPISMEWSNPSEKRDFGLGLGDLAPTATRQPTRAVIPNDTSRQNSLGLAGVNTLASAPDCDPEAMVQDQ